MLPNDVILKKESLQINNMHVKTFLITDFPENAIPGMLYVITHGEHTGPGVIINYSLHFRPATLKFDWKMKAKLRRLKRNIESHQTGDVADEARSEEVKSLDSLKILISTYKITDDEIKKFRENGIQNVGEMAEAKHLAAKHKTSIDKVIETKKAKKEWNEVDKELGGGK